ncbi:hypothetical protein FGG08_001533 [Glutinoglossum americanum]|uniref:ARF GTPase activator n=1 Tax=Glutinoglossum americanum TaxID=1670608 RepID=A0A9P8IAW0_9PEZI|nr:hypothetical protein FGG08_001533 [Glutinoglossum americanum]
MSQATKAQSQKIFEKLKTKPANKNVEWQWDQLRVMKVGGNESATMYFQSHGGSAALASKDPKTKYTSNAAAKYKDELKRRAALDANECVTPATLLNAQLTVLLQRYPEEVVITDIVATASTDGASTPASEPDNDFFSSWDKPSIKRPTPPPSRTATPPVVGRTPSPFLNAGQNGTRSKSPLAEIETASRTTSSAALRKTTTATGPRKANVLGSKKTQKLGAKKIVASDIDFEAAEKKAREEAERIEKLGYNPDTEDTAVAEKGKAISGGSIPGGPNIIHPTPVSPKRAGMGVVGGHGRSNSEIERLGMGVGRLGFGQVGGGKANAAAAPKKLGFGSTASSNKAIDDADDEKYARNKFGTQKGISSDEFFGRNNFDPSAQSEARSRLQGFESASSISSNQYFGRPEDDDVPADDGYGDLEGAARDFVRKFGLTAGDDLDNLTAVLGDGASKLQNAVRNYLNS